MRLFASTGYRQDNINLIDVMDWLESVQINIPLVVAWEQDRYCFGALSKPFMVPALILLVKLAFTSCQIGQGKHASKLFSSLRKRTNRTWFYHLIALLLSSNFQQPRLFKRQGFDEWGFITKNIAQNENSHRRCYRSWKTVLAFLFCFNSGKLSGTSSFPLSSRGRRRMAGLISSWIPFNALYSRPYSAF